MSSRSLLRVSIDDVQEFSVGPAQEFKELAHCERTIVVTTTQGETLELVLHATERQKLKVRQDRRLGWLIPKVYKSKR